MARIAFQYKPNNSLLNRLNPTIKLLLLIMLTVLISSAGDIELLALTLFIITATAISKLNIIREVMKARMLLFLAFIIVATEYMSTKDITEAMLEGLRYIDLIAIALTLSITTDINDMAASLSGFIHPFTDKYAYRFASSVMLTLALIPMIAESASEMMDARRARCGSFFSHPIRNTSEYVVSLMLIILRRLDAFGDALEARLFDRDRKRGTVEVKASDMISLIIGIAICIALLIARKSF